MQTAGYSGGIAFMLADMDERRCSGSSDLYTGLFTAGESNYDCASDGGTLDRGRGAMKTTGRVTREFHTHRIFLPIIQR